jgi:Ser/Thr protein kinase RdoA (MazF antagonist)
MQEIETIINKFAISGELVKIKANKEGHINSTFMSTFLCDGTTQKYTHQKVNNTVFPRPERVMENIQRITSHIQQKQRHLADRSKRCLSLVPTKEGRWYAYDDQGQLWRTYRFIDEVNTYPFLSDEKLAFRFAEAVGTFQRLLADFPSESLHTTIEKFHDMHWRYTQLRAAIKNDKAGRLAQVKEELSFYLENEQRGCLLIDALRSGRVPIRVTHNDTKINNILFDAETGEGVCVIDLDTVMPGTILFDTGDMLRTGSITAAEDEQDLQKVHCDEKLFAAMIKGYRSMADAFLTETEQELLAESGRATTQIMGVRFLTDYLNGDVYYHTERENHNLDRCRTQMALIQDMDGKWETITSLLD